MRVNWQKIALMMAVPAALAPVAPAGAVEVTSKGTLFTDLSYPVLGSSAGVWSFNVSRARVGFDAKFSDTVIGRLQVETLPGLPSGTLAYLRAGYLDMDSGMMGIRFGKQDTMWSIPTEEFWFPRFVGKSFTEAEGLFPADDFGITARFGGELLTVGIFNGEGGLAAEGPGTKAYEARIWGNPVAGLGLGAYARHDADNNTNQGAVGLSWDGGMAKIALEGVTSMKPATTTASASAGIGGSAALVFPKLLPMDHNLFLRGDYYTADSTQMASGSAHVRAIAGISHEWAPGVETSLDYTHLLPLGGGASTGIVAMHGKVSF